MRKFIGGILLLGLIGFGLDRWKSHWGSGALPGKRGETRQDLRVSVPRWAAEIGRVFTYELRYEGVWQSGGEARFLTVGTLELVLLQAEQKPFQALVTYTIRPEDSDVKALPEPLRANLFAATAKGVAVQLDNRAWSLELIAPQGIDAQARDFWTHLLQRTRVDLPETWSDGVWQHEETIGSTPLTAVYKAEQADGSKFPRDLKKSWQQVEATGHQQKGELSIRFQEESSLPEQLRLFVKEDWHQEKTSLQATTQLEMAWRGDRRLSQEELKGLEDRVRELKTQKASSGENSQELAIQTVALKGKSLSEIWRQLREQGSRGEAASQELYLQLKAWIALHPDEQKEILRYAESLSDPNDPTLRQLIKALTAVGSESSQAVLCSLLERSQSTQPLLAQRLATSLGFVQHPSVASQKALTELLARTSEPKLRQSAGLALGIMGRSLSSEGSPAAFARAQTIENLAWQNLQEAKDALQQRQALSVLGNLGPERWQQLEEFRQSSDPQVRGSAYMAMRFSRDSAVTRRLADSFTKESSLAVQQDILQALALRQPDGEWFRSLAGLGESPQISPTDVLFLAKTVSKHAQSYPQEVQQYLQKALSKAKDESTRGSLQGLLDMTQNRQSIL